MSQSKEQLSAEQLLRIVLDTIPLRVFWKDLDLNYLGANQKLLDDIGFKNLDDLIGESDYAIYAKPEEAEPKRDDDREVIRSGQAKLDIEEPLPIEGKELKWLRTNKVPMRTPEGKVIGILGTYQDITDEVQYRQLIEHQALVDPLTELANRRSLHIQVKDKAYQLGGLLFIDLDHFKHVNDTLGHAVGDRLLQLVARCFQKVADRHQATLARLGGDEFSIFKTFDQHCNIEQTLEKIAEDVLQTFNAPLQLEHHLISIGASIGITPVDKSDKSTEDGFTEADLAMYSAKLEGRNQYRFFTEKMKIDAERQHKLYSYLRYAITNNEFRLVYQPQFNEKHQLIGAEALLRWKSAELGNISPIEFIPISEESGMIHEIGEWVIKQALTHLKDWQHLLSTHPNFTLSVNVSSTQFKNVKLANYVAEQLLANNINPKHLEIEITESMLLEHKERAVDTMKQLKQVGVSIAIDDFGTGYSSLSYLASLPLDKLKIDRSFISGLNTNSTNKKLVETIVNLADSLRLNVIAEGVETREEMDMLKELGCGEFQGYLFSKPLPSLEFEQTWNAPKKTES